VSGASKTDGLYEPIEPFATGMLAAGDGNHVYWEQVGNPDGKPAVVLHGGPGSGATPWWRRLFDPEAYHVVLSDQRGCGRSTPNAADPAVDLSSNTTAHLLGDIERLRHRVGVDRWLVLGGSWGSTLALAYAQSHPRHVTEIVLFSVTTTGRREVEWITRDVGRLFPEQWERFRDGVQRGARDGSLAEAYRRLLSDPDPAVRERAARDWCTWEDAHVAIRPGQAPDPRYDDAAFRMCFARLVTHYWSHAAFLPDEGLLRGAAGLAGIPAVLIHGRLDVSSPLDTAWRLSRAWPGSRLVVIDDSGHGASPSTNRALTAATDRFRTG
jgi:proline iminopeptidase